MNVIMRWLYCLACGTAHEWPHRNQKVCAVCGKGNLQLIERKA